MKSRLRFLFLVGALAIAGVLLLQLLWLYNYNQLNRERFEKEVNLAFEDAVKKEFTVRCDTIEQLLYHFLSDTNEIIISSTWNEVHGSEMYYISNKHDIKDRHNFSLADFSQPIIAPDDSVAHYIARRYANMLREEDLVNHIVYFRTQNLGKYLGKKVKQYDFDTARLRPIYAAILAARGIREPFRFYLRKMDSTMNRSNFPDSLQQQFPVITKSFPTYKFESEEKYVRALFGPPTGYLLRQLGWVLGGSVILLIIVGCTLYYLIAIIRREKKLSAIKNDFISNITHELKTPVATISAAMEALERFDVQANKEKTGRYLFISKSELRRLSDMINHILQTSLYEKGQVAINAVTVNLDKMVQTLIANYSLHDKKEVSIVYSNETNSENIIADHLHLYNMLNNLVDNAIKYSGERVDIGIRYYRQDGFNIVSIKDNGIGIANKELPFIFEKFYRVPTGNLHRVKGYGLGLNYVKNIMEKHGGWYKAESQPGFGSTFYIGFAL